MQSTQQTEKDGDEDNFGQGTIERSSILEFERIEQECQNQHIEVS